VTLRARWVTLRARWVHRGGWQVDSTFRISLTDPWVWKDQYRTSRTVYLNNTTSSGNAVHGKPPQTGAGVQRASVLDAGESQVRCSAPSSVCVCVC
jgi:hypothetical protein